MMISKPIDAPKETGRPENNEDENRVNLYNVLMRFSKRPVSDKKFTTILYDGIEKVNHQYLPSMCYCSDLFTRNSTFLCMRSTFEQKASMLLLKEYNAGHRDITIASVGSVAFGEEFCIAIMAQQIGFKSVTLHGLDLLFSRSSDRMVSARYISSLFGFVLNEFSHYNIKLQCLTEGVLDEESVLVPTHNSLLRTMLWALSTSAPKIESAMEFNVHFHGSIDDYSKVLATVPAYDTPSLVFSIDVEGPPFAKIIRPLERAVLDRKKPVTFLSAYGCSYANNESRVNLEVKSTRKKESFWDLETTDKVQYYITPTESGITSVIVPPPKCRC